MPHFVCFCFVSIFPPLKKLCSNIKQTLQLSELFSVVHNRLSRLRSYHSHVCFCRKASRHLIACIARVFLGKRKLPSPSPGSKIRNDVPPSLISSLRKTGESRNINPWGRRQGEKRRRGRGRETFADRDYGDTNTWKHK